ncbi:MAG: dienelactone hydrolase family protein [Rhodobacteraceae bacterium]|nr:dienelactone hydrolase family protein [Paracoccaceae bacterium]
MSEKSKPTFDLSRRHFGAATLAAGLAASKAKAADVALTETDVMIKTRDGNADAVLIHPTEGKHPGVLVWTDIMGLRPEFREMGREIASAGYTVLIPNPFYRTGPAPLPPAGSDFGDPEARKVMMQLMGQLTQPGNPESDAHAYVAFLDANSAVDTGKKIGTSGYCMGGPLVMRTAAELPGRIGAGGSFHGGGLVTDKPDSPHLLVPKMKAGFYFGIADNDDERQPEAKDELRKAFDTAGLPAEIKVYKGCMHGWSVPGSAVYNQEGSREAMGKLLELLKNNIA